MPFPRCGFRLYHDTDGDFAFAPVRDRNVPVTVVNLQDVVFTDIEAFVDFLFLDVDQLIDVRNLPIQKSHNLVLFGAGSR